MGERLHDYVKITDLKDMLEKSSIKFADKAAFKFKTETSGVFKEITYKEYKEQIDSLGTALIDLGLKEKRVAVISENRYEWTLSYLATVCGTGIVVPLDKALPPQELESLIMRSEVEAIFYSSKYDDIMKKFKNAGTTKLKYFISMDLEKQENGIYSQKELIERGKMLVQNGDRRFIDAKIDNECMSIMLFTSGTTAKSKAVALSHKNIVTNLMDIASTFDLGPKDTMLSFLPLHHTFECTVDFLYPIYVGVTLAYCDGIRHIADNIKEYDITVMVSVPILFENMYKKLMKAIESKGKLEKVKKGIKISNLLLKVGIDARKKIFKEVHESIGPKLRLFINGAAALDKEVEEGFNNLGIRIDQGYGLTETSPVISSAYGKYRRLGSVGQVFPSLEAKIVDANEQGVGEVVVKGPSVMLGYYNNEKATNEVIKDGWFYTGDLGYIDKDGYLFIAGRAKSVIVLKNGKNVYPEEIENLINRIAGVKESLVYGKPSKDNELDITVCAKIVYDKEEIQENYATTDELQIRNILWEKIKLLNKTMPQYKYIKDITVTEQELVKTTTQKIKRFEELDKILQKSNK